MDLKELVKNALEYSGYDGLINYQEECWCRIVDKDFGECIDWKQCVPAYEFFSKEHGQRILADETPETAGIITLTKWTACGAGWGGWDK